MANINSNNYGYIIMDDEKIEVEEESANKITLLVLPTQIGKTFTAINRIKTEIEQDHELGKSIHMVYTMNTLLNNKQFAKRLEAIEDTYGKESVCVFTSVYTGRYTHIRNMMELLGHVICGNCKVVIMCSNKPRYTDGIDFIRRLNQQSIINRLFIYYDEMHKYLNDGLRSQIEEINDLQILKGIIGMTATPDRILKTTGFWSRLKLIDLPEFDDSNYSGCCDVQFNCVDDFFTLPYVRPKGGYGGLESQTIGFIEHVLDLYPHILGDDTRSFIPAHKRRNGHSLVRNLIFQRNQRAVIVILNGIDKILQFRDDLGNVKTIQLSSNDEETCDVIFNMISKHNLQHRALVITGFLCVGMGQTLTNQDLGSFTSAIFGHLDLSSDDIYQLFGRVTGRMKHWSNYVQTEVYCPTLIMRRCVTMELCAKKCINGDVITQEKYRESMDQEEKENALPKVASLNKRIPVVIDIEVEEIKTILTGKHKKERIKDMILSNCGESEFRSVIATKQCIQCTAPKTENSYKKHIINVVSASEAGKSLGMMDSQNGKFENTTCWQIYIDTLLNRLIILWQVFE